jgi:hypothetical protein
MSEPIAVYSSNKLSNDDLLSFLKDIGASIIDTPPDSIAQARMSDDDKHIWIYLDQEHVPNEFTEDIPRVMAKLGQEPMSRFVIEISRTKGSVNLAINLLTKFCQIWPCVIYDDEVCTLDEYIAYVTH